MGRMTRKWITTWFQWDVTVSWIPDSQTDYLAGLLFLFLISMLCIFERRLGDTAICVKTLVWSAQQSEEEEEQQYLISNPMKLKFFPRKDICTQSYKQVMIYFCFKTRMQVMHTWQLTPITVFLVLCSSVSSWNQAADFAPSIATLDILLTCCLWMRHNRATQGN